MNVTVVWAAPGVQDVVPVAVDAGATVADAVARSGVVAGHALDLAPLGVAVFGRRVAWHTPLADGDRIELTRPLTADPKEARRARAKAKPLAKVPSKGKRPRAA
jgi:putative ubiquitin-RnfH superfamily antitoxin RatB of RatAB toxin-antitoxin module